MYNKIFTSDINSIIPNQNVSICHKHESLVVTSLQRNSTPGAYVRVCVEPHTRYTVILNGHCVTGNAFVWIFDKIRLIPNYTFLSNKCKTTVVEFNSQHHTQISVGVLFTAPNINDSYILKSIKVEKTTDTTEIDSEGDEKCDNECNSVNSKESQCECSESEYDLPCPGTFSKHD